MSTRNRLTSHHTGGIDAADAERRMPTWVMTSTMNVLTNLLGKAGRVDIDFPKVELKLAA